VLAGLLRAMSWSASTDIIYGNSNSPAIIDERISFLKEQINLNNKPEVNSTFQLQIKYLHKKRSKFVHKGKDEVTLQDIRSISDTAFEVILKLINYSSKFND
jgi:hypothetical protein